MNDDLLEHEKNIENILSKIVSLSKQFGLVDIAKKGESTLENYSRSRKLD